MVSAKLTFGFAHGFRPIFRSAALSVFCASIAIVIGPTRPGTGLIAPADVITTSAISYARCDTPADQGLVADHAHRPPEAHSLRPAHAIIGICPEFAIQKALREGHPGNPVCIRRRSKVPCGE